MADSTFIETPTSLIRLDPRGFVRVTTKQGARDTLESAKAVTEAGMRLMPNKRILVLVDARGMAGQDKLATEYHKGMIKNGSVLCAAVLVGSAFGWVLASLFNGFNSKTPLRFFTRDEAAVAWILEHKEAFERAHTARAG